MIYLDYAAATPMSNLAINAMSRFLKDDFYNPSAAYLPAKKVRAEYEDAKNTIAHCIGAKGTDIIITSGATEANNLAFSILNDLQAKPKCLILATEHDSVLKVAANYNYELIKVDKTGLIDLKDFRAKLTDDVTLVSVALANNEIGTIQPIAEIATIIRESRLDRLKSGNKMPLFLHSDASQAMNLIDINAARMGVDLLTLNSAKVYGPKGVGALYVSHDVRLKPQIYGGGQENGLRSGTENVAGVIGFAAAFKYAKEHINGNRKKYTDLVKLLQEKLTDNSIIPQFLGNVKHKLANFCTISYPGLDAERLIFKLEEQEIYVSTGAACAASKGQKSQTLTAIGLSDQEINGSLRITLGAQTTKEDIEEFANTLKTIINEEANRIGFKGVDHE